MNSGRVEGGAGGARVSFPANVQKAIDDIKEIIGQNHTEDEIYEMLKECSMDPNESTQKLLNQDTFHEVKRKKDKRKEIVNKDTAESKRKPGTQVRVNRGRGSYSSRYASQDAGGGRNSSATNENAKWSTWKAPFSASHEIKKYGTSSSSVAAVSGISSRTKALHGSHVSEGGGVIGDSSMSKSEEMHPVASSDPVMRDVQQDKILDSSSSGTSIPSAPTSGSYFSSSDPVLLPSQDLPLQSPVGTIRREVRESVVDSSAQTKPASPEVGGSNMPHDMPSDSQGAGQNQRVDPIHPASSTTISRPSSNNNNRPQVIGPQKVGSSKEWKPKSTNSSISQGPTSVPLAEVSTVSVSSHPILQPNSVALALKDDTTELQRKLEESHISDNVIMPNHIHVPEAEKLSFCFGSFGSSFGLYVSHNGVPASDRTAPELESVKLSYEKVSVDVEDAATKYPDQHHLPTHGSNICAVSESDISPSKQQVAPGANEHTAGPTPNDHFDFAPPIVNGQHTTSESSDSQARDAPRPSSFPVQQPFNPAYYAQHYREMHASFNNDALLSQLHAGGAANRYNGSAAIVSAQASQSPQESGGPHVLPAASPTPLVTQAAGVMQSSISTQNPHSVFRPLPLPQYPPNYYPYYGPPVHQYYVSPQVQPYLSNGTFPQQLPPGNLYPTPHGATMKYPASQQKQGSNTGNSTHAGIPGSYAPYGVSMPNYTSSSATAAAVTSSSNEDRAAQVKENNIYASGQQNEGPAVWLANPVRDISTLPASTFYNPWQSQLGFPHTQPGTSFPAIFHPAHTAASVHSLLQHEKMYVL